MSKNDPRQFVCRGWTKKEAVKKAQKVVDDHPELNLIIDPIREDHYRIFMKPYVICVHEAYE